VGAVLGLAVLAGVLLGIWMSRGAGAAYTVVKGDTLWGIARAHDLSVDEIRALNDLSGDLIEVGDVLQVGQAATSTPHRTGRKRSSNPKRSRRKTVKAPTSSPSGPRSLDAPEAHACIPFTADPGEEGMVAPEGLSLAQARTALDPVLQEALRCSRDPGLDRADLLFELNVACTGVVDRVDVLDRGQASARYARCVADVLAYADFPPHDLPDGEVITYPVTVEW